MRRALGVFVLTGVFACGGAESDGDDTFTRGVTDAGVPADPSARADAGTRRDDSASSGQRPVSPSAGPSSAIDTVVTISTTVAGLTGTTIFAQPVTLFKDGWGCYDVAALKPGTDLLTHRTREPKDWFKWRRGAAGRIEKQDATSGVWKSLGAEATYPPFARGAVLSGGYAHNGVGGVLLFGEKVVSFTFSSSALGYASGTGRSKNGSYRIDGYGLTVTDASGRSEAHSIVGGDGLIWIDGASFLSR